MRGQHRDNMYNSILNFVIDGIGKSFGKHSIKTIAFIMNTCIDY
jgi:hypothetical protein